MTDKEPVRQVESGPHQDPELYFSEFTPHQIAENTLMFAAAADFYPDDGLTRTQHASFNHEGDFVTIYFEAKKLDPKKIAVHGVVVAEGTKNPEAFSYVIHKDRVVVKGSKEAVHPDEESKLKARIARANLQLALPGARPSSRPTQIQ